MSYELHIEPRFASYEHDLHFNKIKSRVASLILTHKIRELQIIIRRSSVAVIVLVFRANYSLGK